MKERIQKHYKSTVEDYTAQYQPDYGGYPANLKRLDILKGRVRALKARTLLDCGCGEGSPMLGLKEAGADVWGFDFVPEMVEQGHKILGAKGLKDRIWRGDINDLSTFRPTPEVPASFDVTIAMGVFPHIADDVVAMRNMAAATNPGGHVLAEFRNELFSLFTLNRYGYEFMIDRLIRVNERKKEQPRSAAVLSEVSDDLKSNYRLEFPPARLGDETAPGYDSILSKFHNPLEIGALMAKAGLRLTGLYFYHYHAMPPLFESRNPQAFKALSVAMEADPTDWRGYFMASAFVAEGVKEA